MSQFTNWLQQQFGLAPSVQQRLLASLLAIVFIWVIRRVVIGLTNRNITELTARYRIRKTSLYTSVTDNGVLLTMRYLCMPRDRRDSTQATWEQVLDAFGECDDIDFAYPTQRLYYNVVEGKSSARAPSSTALEFSNPTGHP